MKKIKYFICSHCGKQLINENFFAECENINQYFCDDCGKTYIRQSDKDYIEEDAQ